MGRATRGATVMRVKQGGKIVSLALLAPKKKTTEKMEPRSADETDG